VCSHWQYKAVDQAEEPVAHRERIEWLRQILDWREELGDVAGISKELLDEIGLDRIYVFTPEGHVVDMTPNATPVDFAYRVHTEVGHKCRGAKINGKVVPLNTLLKSGDQIEIITGEEIEPRREWLHAHLGYVSTSRARAKVQNWFGLRTKRKNMEDGKRLLDLEFRHLSVEHVDIGQLAVMLKFKKENEMYAAVGAGDISVIDVVETAVHMVELGVKDQQLSLLLSVESRTEHSDMLIAGLGGLQHSLATCCDPVPGESIVGIINGRNTVDVHCQDCLRALQADSYGRLMRLDWRAEIAATFPVTIEVNAYDRRGLLHDITGVFMREETNVIAMNSQTDRPNNRVLMSMVIEVNGINRLLKTIEQIEQLSNVITARRTVAH
jgi:GTP pyrophosphokinase